MSSPIIWAKPEYELLYNCYREKFQARYEKSKNHFNTDIISLETKLKDLNSSETITDLKLIEEIQNFLIKVDKFTIWFNKALQFLKPNGTNQEVINKIADDKQMTFANLISRYKHNLLNYWHSCIESAAIISMRLKKNTLLRKDIQDLSNSLKECFKQIDKFFRALQGPSQEANLQEINVDQYLSALQSRYQAQLAEKGIVLEFQIKKVKDFTTIKSDPQLMDQVLDNMVRNALEHLQENPELQPKTLFINVDCHKDIEGNKLGIKISNPTKLSKDEIYRIAQCEPGYSHKDEFSGSSIEHGIGLASSKQLCQTVLGGDLHIFKDGKTKYFTTTLEFVDLSKAT